jgi:hypothetical protein
MSDVAGSAPLALHTAGASFQPKTPISEGAVLVVPYPFVREAASVPALEGPPVDIMSWRPGTDYRYCAPDDTEAVAHAMGAQLLTVVSIFKPGRYPTRVFYTRRWRDPNGKEFGKAALRIKTLDAFKRIAAGYLHDFVLDADHVVGEH